MSEQALRASCCTFLTNSWKNSDSPYRRPYRPRKVHLPTSFEDNTQLEIPLFCHNQIVQPHGISSHSSGTWSPSKLCRTSAQQSLLQWLALAQRSNSFIQCNAQYHPRFYHKTHLDSKKIRSVFDSCCRKRKTFLRVFRYLSSGVPVSRYSIARIFFGIPLLSPTLYNRFEAKLKQPKPTNNNSCTR